MKKEGFISNLLFLIVVLFMCGIIFFYQTQKIGFHEDEAYSIASSVNKYSGLMTAYKDNNIPENGKPEWKEKEYVIDYVTLAPKNYLNLLSIYTNQASDNHPPLFYLLVHFSVILFNR